MKLLGTLYDWLGKRVGGADEECSATSSDRLAASFATRSLALYIATSYIANAISKCEIKVFEKGKAVKNELYWALNVSPNPNQNASEFWNRAISKCLYENESLMFQPVSSRNWFYIADSFGREPMPLQEDVFSGVSIDGLSIGRSFKSSDVCVFRLEDKRAVGCVSALYDDLARLIASSDKAFEKSRGDRFTWRTPSRPSGNGQAVKQDADAIADMLAPFINGATGVLPLKDGQEITRVASTQTGADEPIELRKAIFDFTAQALKIPQSMMYGNMTNTTEIVNQFITFAVDPYAAMLSDEMTRTFFDYETWDGGRSRIRVDTSHISHVDVFQMADKVEKLFSSGLYTIDDLRVAVGDDALDTDFSKAHWVSKNYALIQDVLSMFEPDASEGGEN